MEVSQIVSQIWKCLRWRLRYGSVSDGVSDKEVSQMASQIRKYQTGSVVTAGFLRQTAVCGSAGVHPPAADGSPH